MRVIPFVIVGLGMLHVIGTTTRAADPLRDEIENSLKHGILEVWFPRALDRENGGFLCDFSYDWKPAGRQPKSVVFQSRLLWLASQGILRYPDDQRYREAADHGFKFLRDVQWDQAQGCLLYTSDAADERSSVDLGGRRITK